MSQPDTMRAFDPFKYLIGNRAAVERIAATRWAWVVGLLFVISAGIARNYDHLDLLSGIEWVIGPIVASLVSTGFIYVWLLAVLRIGSGAEHAVVPQKGRSLLTFLNLVWLTAPCAWIYGIPVESYADLLTATKWNIAFLGIVSVWRVAIIVRAVTILSGAPWFRVLLAVLAPAALEMMVGTYFKAFSLIPIMGGVRMPPHDALIVKASQVTSIISFWTSILSLMLMTATKGRSQTRLCRPAAGFPQRALAVAAGCLALWVMAAIPLHHGVSNRYRMEQLIEKGDYAAAVNFAAARCLNDFSGMHYLPPDPVRYGLMAHMMMLRCIDENTPEWLREELISNAFESCKLQEELDPLTMEELKGQFPEIYERLMRYAIALQAKPARSSAEEKWLSAFLKRPE